MNELNRTVATPQVGGGEGMLFAAELWQMYGGYAQAMGWRFEQQEYLGGEMGGCFCYVI